MTHWALSMVLAIAEKISSGEISATEAVEAAIARARSVNPELNAIVTETFDLAREQVKKLSPALCRGAFFYQRHG